jgi:hypothetical protein
MYGGKWISMLGIPPLTLIFLLLLIPTLIVHRVDVARRARKVNKEKVNEAFLGSWF